MRALGRWEDAQRETERFVDDVIRAPQGDCGDECPACSGGASRVFLLQNALQMLTERPLPAPLTESPVWKQAVERLEQAVKNAARRNIGRKLEQRLKNQSGIQTAPPLYEKNRKGYNRTGINRRNGGETREGKI